jgi:serine/threonine protein kinase
MKNFIHEMEVLQNVAHPNVMSAQAIVFDDENFYIQTEVCTGGELLGRIDKVKYFTENKAAYITYQLLLGINYMYTI